MATEHSLYINNGLVPCALSPSMFTNSRARISHACKSLNVHPQIKIDVVPYRVSVSLCHTRPNTQRACSRKHKHAATNPHLSPSPNAGAPHLKLRNAKRLMCRPGSRIHSKTANEPYPI